VAPVVTGEGAGISPILIGLLAIAAGVGLYFALRNNGHSNSPA
jgi:LPXTG-motif cell wall-anchored protein